MKKITKYLIGISATLVASSSVATPYIEDSSIIVGYTSGTYLRQEFVLMSKDCHKLYGFGARVANTKDLINTIKKGVYKAPITPEARILIESPIAIGPNGPSRFLFDINTGYFIENGNTNELSLTPSGAFTSSPNSLKPVACAK